MAGFETWNSTPEMQIDTVSQLRAEINESINDSRLTTEEADNLRYSLNSAIDGIKSDTFRELQNDIRAKAAQWINIVGWGSSERTIWNYLWIDLHNTVNNLRQDGYDIPDNYSISDQWWYLVFHDDSWKDIATMNWETLELWWGFLFWWNNDVNDNYSDVVLDGYAAVTWEQKEQERLAEVQRMRENLFDANIVFEDPFDYTSIQLASESFWLDESQFRDLIINFQRQIVADWHSPHQENMWKNIGMFERWGNEFWFNQQTPSGTYIWIYDRDGNLKSWGIWS